MNLLAAFLLAGGSFSLWRIFSPFDRKAGAFFRLVALAWVSNGIYLCVQLYISWMRLSESGATAVANHHFISSYSADLLSSLLFLVGGLVYLRDLEPSVALFMTPVLTGLPASIALSTLLPRHWVSWGSVLLAVAGLLTLALALRKFSRDIERKGVLGGLLVFPVAAYAVLQVLALPRAQSVEGMPSTGFALVGFSLGLAFKGLHLSGLALLFWQKMRRFLEAESARQEVRKRQRVIAIVGHELTTNASALQLRLETIESEAASHKPLAQAIREISNLCNVVLTIVRGASHHLLETERAIDSVVGEGSGPQSVVNANDILHSSLLAVRALQPKDRNDKIAVDLQLCKGPKVRCHAARLRQLFTNVLKNAYESFPDVGGTITIATRRVRSGNDVENVLVLVRDEGVGIAEEYLPLLKDEGFTTKEGVGRGRGLFIANAIADELGGDLSIRSNAKKGAQVQIILPQVTDRKLSSDPRGIHPGLGSKIASTGEKR